MKKTKRYFVLFILSFTTLCRVNAMEMPHQAPTKTQSDTTKWNGFDLLDTTFNGVNIKIVFPKTPNKQRDWIWRALFWGHEPQTDIALLNQGFHLAYVEVSTLYGNETAIKIWDEFYALMTTKYQLNPKVVLEGMSRGGLIVFNWADRHADKVACIYADAPVCDIKSWPGGKGKGTGAPKEWKICLAKYGLSEQEALDFRGNPIDHVENIAKYKLPILSVVGDLDSTVPFSENTAILEQRLVSLGWKMTIMHKPNVGHHPHSFKDPKPIVDFILDETNKVNFKKALKDTTVTLAPFFQSHMVLQSGQPINIWGTATTEQPFDVQFGDNTQKAIADKNGNWLVTFPAMKASFTPFQLKVKEVVLEDILIGELWICSGQSNMMRNLKSAQGGIDAYASSNANAIRLLRYTSLPLVAKDGYKEAELQRCNTLDFFKGEWTINDKQSAEQFSSVAWMFGKKLFDDLNTPIGLIQVAVGGSAINNWISPQTLKADPDFATLFTKDWLTNETVMLAHRERAKQAFKNHLPLQGAPYLVGQTPYRWLCEPGFLFEAGIQPLKNLNFKGVIWYQGEADGGSMDLISKYKKLFPMMVNDWRTYFNHGDFPFIYVQLPSFQETRWPELREVQRNALHQIPNSFMAITFDLGNEKDIHPNDKLPVGERISFLALNNVYKTANKKPSFPEVKAIKKEQNKVIIELNQAISSKNLEELLGFEIAAEDGKFVPVKAVYDSETKISIETPLNAQSIRYGWTPYFKPTAKIFNSAGLPLGAFLMDINRYQPDTSICYKTTKEGALMMDIFMPANHKRTDKRPVIVFFFGGGWVSGAPQQFYQQAKYFSDKGFVAISADYRTFSKHKTTPFDCVSDGKSAIRWVREHADSLGIDAQKIIAAGGSAGGHIAACTGMIEGYEAEGENTAVSSVPNAMILFNPVVDTGEKGYGMAKVGVDRKTDISPIDHIKKGTPPTIIFHGTADKTVPFENVERFTKRMNEVGNTCELVPFTGKDHGFFNGSFFRPKQNDDDFNAIMESSLVFLVKLKLDK